MARRGSRTSSKNEKDMTLSQTKQGLTRHLRLTFTRTFGGLLEFEYHVCAQPASSEAVGEAQREAASRAMRTIIISLWLAITAAHAADKATSRPMTNAPVLKVDDAHWTSQALPGQKAADPYSISPCV